MPNGMQLLAPNRSRDCYVIASKQHSYQVTILVIDGKFVMKPPKILKIWRRRWDSNPR